MSVIKAHMSTNMVNIFYGARNLNLDHLSRTNYGGKVVLRESVDLWRKTEEIPTSLQMPRK